MNVGQTIPVGPLSVTRVSGAVWHVVTPDDGYCVVVAADEDGGFLGFDGPQWAVDAVCQAEQQADEAEWVRAAEAGELRQHAEVYPPGEPVPF